MALKKICSKCNKIIDIGQTYCEECTNKRINEKAIRNRHYDNHLRNKRSKEFYHSSEWIIIRPVVISNYKGLDLYAYYIQKEIRLAEMVHHIVEIEEDWNKRLDIANLFPLTNSNHGLISAMYKSRKKETQKLLFELLERWKSEQGYGGMKKV
jgi:hypothetical protein